jgi:hypothetical protein
MHLGYTTTQTQFPDGTEYPTWKVSRWRSWLEFHLPILGAKMRRRRWGVGR